MAFLPLLVFISCCPSARAIDFSLPFFTDSNAPADVRIDPDKVIISNVSGLSQVHVNFTVHHSFVYEKTCQIFQALMDNAITPARYRLNDAGNTLVKATKHKFAVTGAIIATAYFLLLARLIYLHRYLTHEDRWSSWKQEFALETADNAIQKEVAKELVLEIQQRYQTPEKLADFLAPLVSFFNDIEIEKKMLKQFSRLRKTVHYFLLTKLLPNQQHLLCQIPDRLHRLDFLKQLLIQWLTEYKIAIHN